MLNRITAYEASDGSLHRDRTAYLRHEANLIVSQKLRARVLEVCTEGGNTPEARHKASAYVQFIEKEVGLDNLRDWMSINVKEHLATPKARKKVVATATKAAPKAAAAAPVKRRGPRAAAASSVKAKRASSQMVASKMTQSRGRGGVHAFNDI